MDLVKAIQEFRKFTDQPLTLRGSDYAHAVQELNKVIDRADRASAIVIVCVVSDSSLWFAGLQEGWESSNLNLTK